MKRYIAAFVVVAVMVIFAGAAGAQETYKFGVCGFPEESEKQLTEIVGAILKNLADEGKLNLEMVVYPTNEDLEKAIQAKEVQVFIHENYSVFVDYLRDERVQPFLTYSFFGERDAKKCTFVPKDSDAKGLADLRNKRVGYFGSMMDHYSLTNLLKEKPYTFFKSISREKSGPQMLRDLAKGELDGAFVVSYSVAMLKNSNPEMVTRIKMLDCPVIYRMQPIFFVKDSADPELVDTIRNIFINYKNEKAFKTYVPLMNQFKVRFIPVDTDYYQDMIDLYNLAEKMGWDKDYAAWLGVAK